MINMIRKYALSYERICIIVLLMYSIEIVIGVNIHIYMYIYIYILLFVLLLLFWWSSLIRSKNLDEFFTYKYSITIYKSPFESVLILIQSF